MDKAVAKSFNASLRAIFGRPASKGRTPVLQPDVGKSISAEWVVPATDAEADPAVVAPEEPPPDPDPLLVLPARRFLILDDPPEDLPGAGDGDRDAVIPPPPTATTAFGVAVTGAFRGRGRARGRDAADPAPPAPAPVPPPPRAAAGVGGRRGTTGNWGGEEARVSMSVVRFPYSNSNRRTRGH